MLPTVVQKRLMNLSFFISTLFIAAFTVGALRAEEPEVAIDKPTLDLKLIQLGNRFDCWFTIEYAGDRKTDNSLLRFSRTNLEVPNSVTSRDILAETLKRQLTFAHIKVSSFNPCVIHLIDAALDSDDRYQMAAKTTVTFSGVLGALPQSIGERVKGISSRKGGSNLDFFDDTTTRVTIRAKQQPVRDILTNSIPLNNYTRILWAAESFERDGKLETWIQFYGPKQADGE